MKIPSLTSNGAFINAIPYQPAQRRRRLRAALSRRRFIGTTAGVVGGALGASMLHPGVLIAGKPGSSPPTPIPGGLFRVTSFGQGRMPAVINNFNGFVGVAQVQGTGTQTNKDGTTETLLFDTDMRFMKGVYVGEDGAVHKGTFGFV